ncbi:hypothetical protein AYJ54_19315 [Bradyrhizobium centrolobii]|uniref:Uncharacterized protein n=2 Tax=Bradyrhizobium TaxID=374 RepID=A0A176ZIH8_9BRAD|nr:hypothetical protein AYJ54_19315 [Bradyrhizobium centrolobii]OAF19692.1 hypothetical protein AXW67_36000 [Bradyrhizobium neotropicale]
MTTTADAFLAGGVNMSFHQPLGLEEMIAPRIGDCKGFNKFDKGRIYFTWVCTPRCMMKNFHRLRTLHNRKMLHAV